jgi:hypothetical protein
VSERAASALQQQEVTNAAQTFDKAAIVVIVGLAANRTLASQLAALEFADMKPTESTVASLREKCGAADGALSRYRQFLQNDLATMNAVLAAAHLPAVTAPAAAVVEGCGSVMQ